MKQAAPGVLKVLSDRKYRAGTFFCIISAIVNQLTGINAINVYSSTIVQSTGFNQNLGVYLLSLANVVGAIAAPFGSNVLPVHKLLILGQFVMSVFLGLVVIFSLPSINLSTLVLIMIILMILAY